MPHNELPGKVQIPKNFMSLRDKVLRKAAEMIAKVHGVRHICPNAFLVSASAPCLPAGDQNSSRLDACVPKSFQVAALRCLSTFLILRQNSVLEMSVKLAGGKGELFAPGL